MSKGLENFVQREGMQELMDRKEEAGRHVFCMEELSEDFPGESPCTLNDILRRMMSASPIYRAERGI